MTRNLATIKQFADKHPAFTQGQLRWHIFTASSNGLEAQGAIVRIGRRVYLDEDRFFAWIDAQQPVTA